MAIKLIILDVDGCLTDNKIYYYNEEIIAKPFSAKDGFFIKHIMKPLGYTIAIITGGESKIVENRAKVIDIDHIYTGCMNKSDKLDELTKMLNIDYNEVAYFGDDWFDWPAMKKCSYKGSPSDGEEEIKSRVDFVSTLKGGEGSVREFLVSILNKDGRYNEALALYFD
ncbi:MAG: HAD hydrolase family protein [Candidatus Delongbacteria bacterium]|nr:HAD hydrolase family protein [Candidatus Delongbacteria bacterium]MBN2836342.1 HAD hydrolase family protein [Candidatus Delongbacteria bacterium]